MYRWGIIFNLMQLSLIDFLRLTVSAILFVCLVGLPLRETGFAQIKTEEQSLDLLQPGERLQIIIYGEKDLSGVYKIDPRGNLVFPLIGKMPVGGLRIEELVGRLNWNLRKYLVDPQVNISKASANFQSITVLGHVKNPGNFDYQPGLTLIRLISQAGGFEAGANRRKIQILRIVNGKKQVIFANGSNIIKGKEDDPEVEAGDLISIPESIF